MWSRSLTWLLFLSLPLMALARRFPNGSGVEKLGLRLKISIAFSRDESLSEIMRFPEPELSSFNDFRRKLEGVPRLIGGVGSRPPKCIDRCGLCTPCLPVNVPVGGAKTDNEYYPEVWRCKCDNRLYIP